MDVFQIMKRFAPVVYPARILGQVVAAKTPSTNAICRKKQTVTRLVMATGPT